MENIKPLYLYDIACYRISSARHHMTEGIDYQHSPAYRHIDSMQRSLNALAKEKGFPQSFFGRSNAITENSFNDKGIKRLYATIYLPDGCKDDYVITLYRLFPNREVEKEIYSYAVGRFLLSSCYDEGKTLYDVCTFTHGPLYDRFETMKPELGALCSGALDSRIAMPNAMEEVAALAPSVLNIGRWEETLTDKESSDRNGEFELMLKVFRVQIEG